MPFNDRQDSEPPARALARESMFRQRRTLLKTISLGTLCAAAPPILHLPFARAAFAASGLSQIHTCTELFAGRTSIGPTLKGTAQPACVWKSRALKVRFLEGDPTVQAKVAEVSKEWVQYSGVDFVFGDFPDAEVRIAFKPPGSWSYVGSCQYDLPQTAATMNFGWLTPSTDDGEYKRVVLHEFGHALGLVHEHQNPATPIKWNLPAVYAYYQQVDGWNEQQTYANVIQKYSEAETNHGPYDPKSIMEYPIPKELTLDGFEVGWNRELSDTDKTFIETLYPRT